ncbi:GAF domain-containing sensor histidine kinase [Aestuariibacter halophilus]|uniref:histidine kinase n=1 Tax=Fluctibacter halophilus TaxID=226011 RepID=A0ABS8G4B7_9ALTE|nr:GAF domain-containing sensor histidine kinase [Aestuariibacter halophilus]MCC2615434.1 GAF domain-containing sensor histidine kinase [Aestuariibacter halophilus]
MRSDLENVLLNVSMHPDIDSGDMVAANTVILNAVIEGLSLQRVGIWLWEGKRQGIVCQQLIDTYHATSSENLRLERADFPDYFTALDTQRSILADDAHQHPATRAFSENYLTPLNIAAMLDVPIRHHGDMIGIICCEHIGCARQWQTDEATFVAALADLYGRALTACEREQYQRQLETLNQQLEERIQERTQALQDNLNYLKETQKKLIESEKLAALGSLVAGVAHEVNTPLGVAITASTTASEVLKQLSKQLDTQTLTRRNMENQLAQLNETQDVLQRNLSRAAELISHFKNTAVDQNRFDVMEIELVGYVNSTLQSLRPVTKKQQVTFDVQGSAPIAMRTLPGALAQIFTNLVINASKHAFNPPVEAPVITITLSQQGEQVMITFADNGNGMAPEVLKHALEPFFTTQRHSGGTGLGLSIVHNLVTQTLEGSISLTSEQGQGTRFDIRLPRVLVPKERRAVEVPQMAHRSS